MNWKQHKKDLDLLQKIIEYWKSRNRSESKMELRINDYVRTKDGLIMKIEKIERNAIKTDISLNNYSSNLIDRRYLEEFIIKSSPNIIDLIEVGDYVNGYKVTMLEDEYYDDVTDSVKKIKDKEKIKIILGNEEQFYGVYAKDIKSILTKEQFESMEYRIGE